jgi:hypothetical protein
MSLGLECSRAQHALARKVGVHAEWVGTVRRARSGVNQSGAERKPRAVAAKRAVSRAAPSGQIRRSANAPAPARDGGRCGRHVSGPGSGQQPAAGASALPGVVAAQWDCVAFQCVGWVRRQTNSAPRRVGKIASLRCCRWAIRAFTPVCRRALACAILPTRRAGAMRLCPPYALCTQISPSIAPRSNRVCRCRHSAGCRPRRTSAGVRTVAARRAHARCPRAVRLR